ncbi:response regulator [Sulfitobacter sp.]|jgi:signal transduction histidine kinase/DNA-binding response OmpR family regulator|uniref:response regulator n=1 Tax=Sulfitobacter sp. TaxID=1903071 RepID=UPI00272D9773|nr:response regulator [Sulfitobacter sp.]
MKPADQLAHEQRRRAEVEALLEQTQAELCAAYRKLDDHAQNVSVEISETRAEVENIRGENKRVMSDLCAAREQIELTQRRLWHSVETIHDGFAFFNKDNEMIMANRSYLAVFDGIDAICPGVSYSTILRVLTDEGIVNIGRRTPEEWRAKMLLRSQQKAPAPIIIKLWNGAYIKIVDQRGKGGDIVSLARDITETVEYQRKLVDARATAEAANSAKSLFLAKMSHEIRTPMNGIVGMTEVLGDTALTQDQRLYVDTIKTSGEALLVIINDVLDFSRIEANRLSIHPAPFDLERVFQEVLLLLQPLAVQKGLDLALDYDLFLPRKLVGDAGRIRQVLTNLVGNAVKFTQNGHILIRATGLPDAGSGNVLIKISIEDTGIGIAPDMIEHIMGEFTQASSDPSPNAEGTGLGLAICQRLVQLMGGEIWVTSEHGVGSCFGFELPLKAQEDSAAPPLKPPPFLRHVLIVERETICRSILQRNLEHIGVRVTSCGTGAAGLAALDGSIDLLLVDDTLPDMDGIEFARAVHGSDPATEVILYSQTPDKIRDSMDDTSVRRIMKNPISVTELLAEVSTMQPVPVGTRPMRVLAAEDNKTNRLVLRKMLQRLNIDLQLATNGQEAVALFETFRPDLVFMDISMPKMNGKDAAAAIRALEGGASSCPIVALTAHAIQDEKERILAAGLDHFLTKPLRKAELVALLNRYCPNAAFPLEGQLVG